MENKGKKKKKGAASILIIIVALALIAVSLCKLIPSYLDYHRSAQTYEEIAEEYVTEEEATQNGESAAAQDEGPAWKQVKIDFADLKKENGDIIGWLRFDDQQNLPISYPILYSGDDTTYLRHDLYGEPRTAGCIFLEGLNTPDLSDCYSIIYGHNMRNGTMFGTLKQYRDQEDFWSGHQYFTIYTETTIYRYQIFSYYDVAEDADIYLVGYEPGEELQRMIDGMVSASYLDTGIRPQGEDRILTLSTCTSAGDHKRFVLHGVLVEQIPAAQ